MGVQELCPLLGTSLANPGPRAFLASLSQSTPWGRLLAADPDPRVCIGKRRSSSIRLCPPVPAPDRTSTRRHRRQPCIPLLWTQGIRARVSCLLSVRSAGGTMVGAPNVHTEHVLCSTSLAFGELPACLVHCRLQQPLEKGA